MVGEHGEGVLSLDYRQTNVSKVVQGSEERWAVIGQVFCVALLWPILPIAILTYSV